MYARPTVSQKPRTSQFKSFPSPVAGWIANRNLAQPNQQGLPTGAAMLENWFPTATGAVMRRGSELYATLGSGDLPVTAMFSYKNGNQEELFAATDMWIYDITVITSASNQTLVTDTGDMLVTDLGDFFAQESTAGLEVYGPTTGGDWVALQFATTGDVYLLGVNGQDDGFIYDGDTFYPNLAGGVWELGYDAETGDFTAGQTLTGGTSGATATIMSVTDNGTDGTLQLRDIVTQTVQWTLNYDAETTGFTVGATLTGGTSGATAVIDDLVDAGTTGTLTLSGIAGGPFEDNEAITDSAGGAAVANGTEVFLTGGPFQDDEIITDGLTGSATANGVAVSLSPGVTFGDGLTTANMSYLWSYKERLFFVEKDSLNAWYLQNVDSVGGPAVRFPLGGIFNLGGSLLFGASWSLDAGDGLSAKCIFVSTEGEVAVFSGAGPESTDWTLVGVYRIGKPMGKTAHIRAGGDLVIATDIGFLPLSQALQRDYAALSPGAVSFNIEVAWNEAVALRSSVQWRCEVWPTAQMVIVALPTINEQRPEWFVANTRTGAWAPFVNWDATCVEVFQGRCFFGSQDGRVVEANVTGVDEGEPYTASYVPLFDDLGSPGSLKIPELARGVFRSKVTLQEQMSAQADFQIELPSAPDSAPVPIGSEWGTGVWGQSTWGEEGVLVTQQEWHSVGGEGYALATGTQITSGALVPLDAELVRTDLTYVVADIFS